jgi:hypothetical protein
MVVKAAGKNKTFLRIGSGRGQEKTTGEKLFVNAYTGIDKQYQERFFPFDSIP